MGKWFERYIHKIWYPVSKPFSYYLILTLLLPFSFLYTVIATVRKFYLQHYKQVSVTKYPVCVVGNIAVGGTGKTPFVIFFAELLKQHGFKPGIVSRGYSGSKARNEVVLVDSQAVAAFVGEEPKLIHQKTQCPVVVGVHRNQCIQKLCQSFPEVDIIISDDGLQHYAMHRDLEIGLMDGIRKFGNGFCLPAGPLRELCQRFNQVDFVVVKQSRLKKSRMKQKILKHTFDMQLLPQQWVNVKDHSQQVSLEYFRGKIVHAVTGIGNPSSFFELLSALGIKFIPQVYPDHYAYTENDFNFSDEYPIIMTEKDAIKCTQFASAHVWMLALTVSLPDDFSTLLINKIKSIQKKD
ncbi:tetraacyldisaccharide 4'-kinase [Candidatus Berkiella cookevillensis]|uniref:Tetraacyldisaccharide 4'-kinase n=1 Tax=Candidatus Berkiella cookevillensis TaxID=437022 RepID=A0A0Q9YRZ5_9GAMM|nr:tetraacyldisaccharide 4'-kinase [Candidatus Berkiella cookevillensis]MCS5708981.1 tetraacyldisaccharide 4'-kinase [Candidatus Berkiella cookevillensis]